MNLSGQTITIGTWIARTGAAFAFLSPILGWIGTAVSPQNLAIAATVVGLVGHESDIFRKVAWWSVGLLLALCLLIGLQSTPVLSWMLPS